MSKPNIAIVGAGLFGRLAAFALAKSDAQITLFDQDTSKGKHSAGYAAAGLLTPFGESISCEPAIVNMGCQALELWPKLLAKLTLPVPFQRQGSLVISHQQDIGDYQNFCRHLASNFDCNVVQPINHQRLATLEPALADKFSFGLFIENEGCIDNRALLEALRYELELIGVVWHPQCRINALTDGKVKGSFLTDDNKVERNFQATFDLVIDCRGNGAGPQAHVKMSHVLAASNQRLNDEKSLKDSAILPDLRAVRGELLHIYAPMVSISRPVRLMHPRYKLYLAPKGQHHYVLGATEIESADLRPVTVRSALELLSALYSLHPGFAEAEITEQISQCRPAFSNNYPQINCQEKLIQVNGLYRHGYLISPFVLKALLAFMQQSHGISGDFASSISAVQQSDIELAASLFKPAIRLAAQQRQRVPTSL